MAYMGGREMVLARPNCNPIKLEVEAQSSTLSMQCSHTNKCMICRSAKSEVLRFNHGVKAPARRVHFQIIAIFGTMICKSPLLVDGLDGLARADEKRNDLLIGLGEGSSDEVVLQGSPFTARLERPSVRSLRSSEEDEPEEILSVKLKLLRGKASAFHVFINLPDADEQTSITRPEFSGLYFHEPRRVKSPDFEYQKTIFRIGISDIIKDLGLMEQPSIPVTFVPCGADKGLPIVLESVRIELD